MKNEVKKKNFSIFQDWKINNSKKGRIILVLFRIAQLANINRLFFIVLLPYSILYKILVEWVFCIEIPYKLQAGESFRLFHGQGLVINDKTTFGHFCTVRHNTTIGNKSDNGNDCPQIGNNVDIGAHCCVIGNITIGDNVIIGAGTIVTKSIPANSVVVGNPARIIKELPVNY
jgi:putative colanic acid biosynthesis acetyltransferase WcaB